MKLIDLLAADGIYSLKDIDAKKDNTESRYRYLVRTYGIDNADKVLRIAEVQSWFPKL